MEFTGERFLPTLAGDIRLEHYHRYHWCSQIAAGKKVLDIASGEGYGSNLLASVAQSVVGVDISEEAVAHAKAAYVAKQNLSFVQGSAAQIPLPDNSVDIVVSFETIEHHTQHEEMIAEIKRVLTADGVLVISSPNKEIYSDLAGGNHNHFHVKELYYDELNQLLSSSFSSIRYFGQTATATSLLSPMSAVVADRFSSVYTESAAKIREGIPSNPNPLYFVAIATNSEQPSVSESTAFFSEIDNALQERTLEIVGLGEEIKRMSGYIEEVHQVLEAKSTELSEALDIIDEVKQVLGVRDAELQEIKASRFWKIAQLLNRVKK